MSRNRQKTGGQGAAGVSRDAMEAGVTSGNGVGPLWVRVFVWCVLGAAGLLAFWGFMLVSGQVADVDRIGAEGWGQYAPAIVGNKIRAVWHAAFMTACAGFVLWWMVLRKNRGAKVEGQGAEARSLWSSFGSASSVIPVLVALAVGLDAISLSRSYVQTIRRDALVGSNPAIEFLKSRLDNQRVYLIDQSGFYNNWMSVVFPYHEIPAFNIVQMPRMPQDYKAFLGAIGHDLVRLWQLGAVRYVLCPATAWVQIQHDSRLKDCLEPVLGFNVVAGPDGATFQTPPPGQSAQHWILAFKKEVPRFAYYEAWEVSEPDRLLDRLAAADFDVTRRVLVTPDSRLVSSGSTGLVAVCKPVDVRTVDRQRINLTSSSNHPGVLVVSQHYAPDWKVTVDGTSARVIVCNSICLGVYVPSGRHDVDFVYAPPMRGIWIQLAGLGICGLAGLSLVLRWLLQRRRTT